MTRAILAASGGRNATSHSRAPETMSMLATLAVLTLAGCASLTTTALWKDPRVEDWRLGSVLVMGVAEDQLARRAYEDAMAEALRARGVRAAASYSLLPDSNKLSQEQIDDAIANQSFEAVLVTHVVGTDEETVYYPGHFQSYSRPMYDTYYRYYNFVYDRVYEPGYTLTFTTVSLETSLYRAPSKRVAWGMRTKSVDPHNINRLVKALVNETVANLGESGFLP